MESRTRTGIRLLLAVATVALCALVAMDRSSRDCCPRATSSEENPAVPDSSDIRALRLRFEAGSRRIGTATRIGKSSWQKKAGVAHRFAARRLSSSCPVGQFIPGPDVVHWHAAAPDEHVMQLTFRPAVRRVGSTRSATRTTSDDNSSTLGRMTGNRDQGHPMSDTPTRREFLLTASMGRAAAQSATGQSTPDPPFRFQRFETNGVTPGAPSKEPAPSSSWSTGSPSCGTRGAIRSGRLPPPDSGSSLRTSGATATATSRTRSPPTT